MQRHLSALLASCCLYMFSPDSANAQQSVPLAGSLTTYFSKYQSNIDSFLLPIQGQFFPSGPVTLTLDLSDPVRQVNIFDFDKRLQTVSVDLILIAPALQALGFKNMRLHIDETGPINALTPEIVISGATQNVCINSTLDSTGIIGLGLLEGWAFAGRKGDPNGPGQGCPKWRVAATGHVVDMTPSITDNMTGATTASLTSPNGLQVIPLSGTFSARYDISPVPESSTCLLLMTGGILLLGKRMFRKRDFANA